MNDLFRLDATAQAQLVASGQVSSLELVDAAIARIQRLNPLINAVVHTQFDRARERARGRLPEGPFRGVPFLLKDLASGAEAGQPLSCGCRMLAQHVADHDTEMVRRFRAAGLVNLGRSTTPEFGIPPSTEAALYGPTLNPWDTGYSTGGSSGGAAAAVAARLVPLAHATDAGGSIRIPASACGVFGLKPSRGRTPTGPRMGESFAGLVSELCCSVSVRDSAALLDAVDGAEPGAPYATPPKAAPYVEALTQPPRRLRIAVMRAPYGGAPVHEDCLTALDDAVALCSELGHDLVEAAPQISDLPRVAEAFSRLYQIKAAMEVQALASLTGRPVGAGDIEALTHQCAQAGQQWSATDYVHAQRALQRAGHEVGRFFLDHDLLLTPTMAQPPVAIGRWNFIEGDAMASFAESSRCTAFTPLFNATGQPAMSVPLYWNAQGMPIGVQFGARLGEEGLLFQLAAQLEAARPWAQRLPAMAS